MRILLITLAYLLFISAALQAQVISPRLMAEMTAAVPGEKIPVIIELSERTDLRPFLARSNTVRLMSKHERRVHRANLIQALRQKADLFQVGILGLLRDNGIVAPKSLWINNSIAAEVTPEIILLLSTKPAVSRIKTDAVLYLPEAIPAATGVVEDNLTLVKAPDLWGLGYDGLGMVVATMDSGVDINHPDLGGRWRGIDGLGNSWFDPNGEHPVTPTDMDGHGTGVMGVMVGGNAGGTSIGVAPGAQWIAAKIFDDSGASMNSKIHEGYQWLLDPDMNPATDDAPDVVNNSWGFELNPGECVETPDPITPGSDFDTDFHPDITALRAAGIAVVFSAGNAGPNPLTDVSLGNYPESVAIGSVDTLTSTVSTFSSRGPSACDGTVFPEVVAPGELIRSADLTLGGAFPNTYVLWSGTSFAAPHVAGIMALLGQAFPGTPLVDIEDAITVSAKDLGTLGPDNDYGYGLVDGKAAFDWLILAPNIAVTDPVSPENDRSTTFGPVEPSVVSQQALFLSNSGRGELAIGSLVLTGDPVFALLTDNCTSQVLTDGQSCDIIVEFLSSAVGMFSGNIAVPSNDFDEPTVNISLIGIVEEGALELVLVSPNGGEIINIGSTFNIQWTPVGGAVSYRLHYYDADSTVHLLASLGNVTSYSWTIPASVVAEAGKTMRVIGLDGVGAVVGIDFSDAPFTIASVGGTLLFPNGGETFSIGGPAVDIQWVAHPDAVSYRLHYYDADGTVHLLAILGNITSYSWTIPASVVAEAGKTMRVIGLDGAGTVVSIDFSDTTFTVVP